MGDTVRLDPALAPALAAAGLASVDGVLGLGEDPGATSLVARVEIPVAGTSGRFHLKRYRYPTRSASRGLLGRGTLWGTPPEVREFLNLSFLRQHGVPAVRPVVAVARTRGLRLVAHALLTEHVEGAVDLATRLRTPGDPVREDPEVRRRTLQRIGHHLASMHAEGFLHRDAYARNVLVRVDEDDVRVWFLDCRAGGTGLFGKGPLLDLATLDMDLAGRVPATDRLRGLKAWLAEGEPSWHVHRKVARLRERLRRSEERRGRRR